MDRNLFEYLTKRAGLTLQDVADAWGVNLSAVYKRLSGEVEIKRSEMEIWMLMVRTANAGPVFFPRLVAEMQHDLPIAAGGSDGL